MKNYIFLKTVRHALKLVGLYGDEVLPKFERILLKLWSICSILLNALTCIQCLIYLINMPFDLLKNCVPVMNTAIYFSAAVNGLLMMLSQRQIFNLFKTMEAKFILKTRNGMECISMADSIKMSELIPTMWQAMVMVTICCYTLSVSFSSQQTKLPLVMWYPYDVTVSPNYELTMLWQILVQLNMGQVFASGEPIFPCVTVLFGKQFGILGSNLKNNFFRALIECGLDEDSVLKFRNNLTGATNQPSSSESEVLAVIESEQFRKLNRQYFNESVQHHQTLMEFYKEVNDLFKSLLLARVCLSTFLVVFVSFSMLSVEDLSQQIVLCAYVADAVALFLICCMGGQVFTQGVSSVPLDLYESPWYLYAPSLKRSFQIVQMITIRDIYFKAGDYFNMTGASLVMFMKTSFSYITLLRQLTEK